MPEAINPAPRVETGAHPPALSAAEDVERRIPEPGAGDYVADASHYLDQSQAVTSPEGETSQAGLVRRVIEAYFEPKSFETEALYRALGVRFFKKWMPSTGDWVMHHVRHSTMMPRHGSRMERVETLERATRVTETAHLGMLAVGTVVFVGGGFFDSLASGALATAVQTGFNVYPIMLQRYNRIRANRLLRRSGNGV